MPRAGKLARLIRDTCKAKRSESLSQPRSKQDEQRLLDLPALTKLVVQDVLTNVLQD